MDNQIEFRRLCQAAGLTQAEAAKIIEAESLRSCKVRTVRAWLADPRAPSSRPCPSYAIKALKEGIEKRQVN